MITESFSVWADEVRDGGLQLETSPKSQVVRWRVDSDSAILIGQFKTLRLAPTSSGALRFDGPCRSWALPNGVFLSAAKD